MPDEESKKIVTIIGKDDIQRVVSHFMLCIKAKSNSSTMREFIVTLLESPGQLYKLLEVALDWQGRSKLPADEREHAEVMYRPAQIIDDLVPQMIRRLRSVIERLGLKVPSAVTA